MRPDVTYEQLVVFVSRIAYLGHAPLSQNQIYGTVSQQMMTLRQHVEQLEQRVMSIETFVTEARNMITHGGSIDGSIKRPTKTNTLAVR